eukprot:CAMPEP_0171310174 /NCGR_PEP_ID=MMETSP0816-20121228/20407_1 /TAXON_ID=420281 /ORGANISM="Proboscia inermis, Strain CCAP1064/1" /LENGTH=237 /DNA_ID=CAMNT_0011794189 /DNA_START=124 /DNA_END=837 /DNA_ORIENTATION=+
MKNRASVSRPHIAEKKKAAPKKAATKKPKKVPLGDASNRVNIGDPAHDARPSDAKKDNDFETLSDSKSLDSTEKSDKPKKTIKQVYQKKTQLEHILLCPDTYIGSVERVNTNMWVLDSESNKIVDRNISCTPGLFKIFDEIEILQDQKNLKDSTNDPLSTSTHVTTMKMTDPRRADPHDRIRAQKEARVPSAQAFPDAGAGGGGVAVLRRVSRGVRAARSARGDDQAKGCHHVIERE